MEDRMVRVDEESLKQIKFLAENLFEVPTTYRRIVEEALSYLWYKQPELFIKYEEQKDKND